MESRRDRTLRSGPVRRADHSRGSALVHALYIPNTQRYAAYQTLIGAGEAFGLNRFGMYAVDSMRMEKGYGHWKADFITELNRYEPSLERFVDPDHSQEQIRLTVWLLGRQADAVVSALCSFDPDNTLPRGVAP